MKKLLAILLTVAMLFATASTAFAADASQAADDSIATISLCSNIYVWPVSGHTWIYVHNNSNKTIRVGLWDVPPDQGVSIGSFSFSVDNGWGLYYNIESYKENLKDRMGTVRSISEDMDADDLASLNKALKNYPNMWSFGINCATFSFSMWNSVTGDAMFSLLIPAISDFMIMLKGGEKGVLEMYQNPRENVYRQKGSGDDAYLVPVSDYTAN